MRVYFVRHGESEANVRRVFSSRDPKRHPLTVRGREQAQERAEDLKRVHLDRAFSSDLLRAVQTMEILLDGRPIPRETTTLLREHDPGDWEGASDEKTWDKLEEIFMAWLSGDIDARPNGGESLVDLQSRFFDFISMLTERYGEQGESILVVGHAGIFAVSLPLLFVNVDVAFVREQGLDNADLIVGEYDDGRWCCSEWAGVKLV